MTTSGMVIKSFLFQMAMVRNLYEDGYEYEIYYTQRAIERTYIRRVEAVPIALEPAN